MKVSVILPSYNPNEKLPKTIKVLTEAGFDDIIVVNDGSREECAIFFNEIADNYNVTVLTHEKNMGKGRALKTAFKFFLDNREEKSGIVTVDDDLQHGINDIIACAKEMEASGTAVFGARNFKSGNVPPKSRFGNNVTTFTFRAFCGIKITDTQTGLRAIPRSYLPILLEVGGERFEYETNMLLSMKQNDLTFKELPIETIYIDSNSETHFHPFKDSIKIYAVILKYILSSLSASIIDLAVFTLFNLLLPKSMDEVLRIFLATAIARIISSAINYTVNRNRVFKSKSNVKSSLIKYYTLSVCQMALSYGLVFLLTFVTQTSQSILQTLFKMIIDTILFFLCFTLQREWVFKSKSPKKVKKLIKNAEPYDYAPTSEKEKETNDVTNKSLF